MDLIRTKYSDFKPSFASEKLLEIEGVGVNHETLRLWMVEAGLWKARKKKYYKYFSFRERKDYFGEMIQFDGSYHKWFEDRLLDSEGFPLEVCLLASIDDATGIIEAKFDMNESVFAVFSFGWNTLKNMENQYQFTLINIQHIKLILKVQLIILTSLHSFKRFWRS